MQAFLHACKTVFGMKDRDLFDPYDLVQFQEFGKVRLQSVVELSFIIVFNYNFYKQLLSYT